jgi:hypothetical protein
LAQINPALQIGGKPITQIHTWTDPDNTVQVKGTDFTSSIDPKTGNLVFQTGLEGVRDQFRNITNLEALIGSAQQKNPDILVDPINLRFVNTQTGATNSVSRISAKMEERLNELMGPANNPLKTITPIAKNTDATYIPNSQMPNLKIKNAEYNQAKKDNLQTGINQAKSQSPAALNNLGRQQTIDDKAA